MRLPWPFGHRTSPDGPPSAAAEGAHEAVTGSGGADATPPPTGANATPPSTGAWRSLPPIQRVVGEPPLVAPSSPFLAGVPGHVPLPPIVQPLGHEASPAAPSGIVAVHARPVPSLTSQAELRARPVQRRHAPETPAGGAPVVEPPSTTGEPAPDAAPPTPATIASSEPAATPVRHLASVPGDQAVTPPARPLTRTEPTLVTVSRAVPRSAGAAATRPLPQPGSPGAKPRRGLGAPIKRDGASATPDQPATVSRWTEGRPASSSGRGSLPIDGSAGGPAAPPPGRPEPAGSARDAAPVRDAALARPRRPGLGAPIPVPPASAVAQRIGASPESPSIGPTSSPAGRSDAAVGARSPATSGEASAMSGQRTAASEHQIARALPVLPVSRRRHGEPAPDGPDIAATSRAAAPAARRAPERPGLRPTVGVAPLRPVLAAQRSATRLAEAEPSPAPVVATWVRDERLPARITALPASREAGSSFASVGATHLAPTGAAPGPATVGPASSVREITFPPPELAPEPGPARRAATDVQRVASGAAADPDERTVTGLAWSAPPTSIVPRDRARPTPERPLTLARLPAPAAAAASGSPATSATAPTMGWIVADPASPSASPTVQLSRPTSGAVPVATFTATPVIQRQETAASTAAPAAATGAEGHSDAELDDLAKALFGRIRGQLRAEIIHDREAKGLSFDAF